MAVPTTPKKVRGVYEHPKGSEIWWIQYFERGKRHRERVGTKGNAIKLYQKRKTQILVGNKLPELQRKRVTLRELIDDAIAYARKHNSSARDHGYKGELLRKALGTRTADDIKPDEFAAFICRREVSPATFNRYRAFLSLCYREGMRHAKVVSNPARMLAQKREAHGRERFPPVRNMRRYWRRCARSRQTVFQPSSFRPHRHASDGAIRPAVEARRPAAQGNQFPQDETATHARSPWRALS